ncbi:ATP-binding protein [Fibrobacterota bacterium]
MFEAIYNIATGMGKSQNSLADQIVVSLARILKAPYVVIRLLTENGLKSISKNVNGNISHDETVSRDCGPCGATYQRQQLNQQTGDLSGKFPLSPCIARYHFKSYLGVPSRDSKGEMVGIICVFDFSERTFNRDEIHLVEIFSHYIGSEIERLKQEEQLRKAQQMEVLGQLASGVAHEVRNPLNGILALSEALSQDLGGNPEYTQYLEHMRNQVERLSILMRDLLDLGRPVQKTDKHRVPLTLICDSALDLWKQPGSGNGNHVRFHAPQKSGPIEVEADISRIQQVIVNVLDNSRQHNPGKGEITLHISPMEKHFHRISISDRGSGIQKEHLNRVFEPFFTTRNRGTGLGLNIAKNIVENHGGFMRIFNNNPEPGCTVEIALPAYSPSQP